VTTLFGQEPLGLAPRMSATVSPSAPAAAESREPVPGEPSRQAEVEREEQVSPQAMATPEAVTKSAAAEQAGRQPESPPAWREEVAARVEKFRRRRSRLQRGADEDVNLDLDFEGTGASPRESPLPEDASPSGRGETDFGLASATEAAALDSLTLETTRGTATDGTAHLDVSLGDRPPARRAPQAWDMLTAKEGPGEPFLADAESALQLEDQPRHGGMDAPLTGILFEPGESSPQPGSVESEANEVHPASLGWRFLAALVDGLILLVSAVLFGATFWLAGGRLSPHPVNIAVLSLIAVFLFLSYFGCFTVVTAATPGLSCVGIRVCNLDGAPPTGRESWWRAFGYLVSAAALLLGFVWALFDGEGLTWHDHMSGTLLVRARGR
jgi:uncharacterized RDD family membrane protein YckC